MFSKRQPVVDPIQEQVTRHLRAADELVRRKQFTDALVEIERANKLDPNNLYARSLLERTRSIVQTTHEHEGKSFDKSNSVGQRMETLSQLLTSTEEFIRNKNYQQALDTVARVYHIDPHNDAAKAFSEQIIFLMRNKSDEGQPFQHTTVPETEHPISTSLEHSPGKQSKNISSHAETITPSNVNTESKAGSVGMSMYRQLLKECWADGIITAEESSFLERIRIQFLISEERHKHIESDVRIEVYTDALCMMLREGVLTDNKQEVLDSMRKKYGMTQEEQKTAENKFSHFNETKFLRKFMLIVDPNMNDRISLERAFNGQGYEVKLTENPYEAIHFLSSQRPDLILSEAVFPPPDIDGFGFYQKVHSIPHLSSIPFMMMTVPSDARILRAGVRMGVDYFIQKPLQIDFVIAVVEGKLKSKSKIVT